MEAEPEAHDRLGPPLVAEAYVAACHASWRWRPGCPLVTATGWRGEAATQVTAIGSDPNRRGGGRAVGWWCSVEMELRGRVPGK
jgi:hypothetical protein